MSKTMMTDLYLQCFSSRKYEFSSHRSRRESMLGSEKNKKYVGVSLWGCRFCREVWILLLVIGCLPTLLPPFCSVSRLLMYLPAVSLFRVDSWCGINSMVFLSGLWAQLWNRKCCHPINSLVSSNTCKSNFCVMACSL